MRSASAPLCRDEVVRLILALKAASLARGYSGVRPETIAALLALRRCRPPAGGAGQGIGRRLRRPRAARASVAGADRRRRGALWRPADAGAEALAAAGLAPLALGPKEGLALINGTQVSTALALSGLFTAERAVAAALVAGAMSVEAVNGTDVAVRRAHPCGARPARADRGRRAYPARLIDGSGIRASHADCDRVQDPYSLRCQPQVMGALPRSAPPRRRRRSRSRPMPSPTIR